MADDKKPLVFVSHPLDDTLDDIKTILKFLESFDTVHVWHDEKSNIKAKLDKETAEKLKASDLVVIFYNEGYQTQPRCKAEAESAQQSGKDIILVNVERRPKSTKVEDWFKQIIGDNKPIKFYESRNQSPVIVRKVFDKLRALWPKDPKFIIQGKIAFPIDKLLDASSKGNISGVEDVLKQIPTFTLQDPETWKKESLNPNGDTPLHRAVCKNQKAVLQLLWPKMGRQLVRVADAKQGLTPIHRAALANATECVAFLLKQDASLLSETSGKFDRTILHIVANKGYLELVTLLVETYKADVFAKSNLEDDEDLPVHLAAAHGHLPVVKYLVSVEPKVAKEMNAKGFLPIHKAALNNEAGVVDFFLTDGGQKMEEPAAISNRNILHLAALEGHVQLLRHLVTQYGADLFLPSSIEDLNSMPIHLAAVAGQLPVIEYMVTVNPKLDSATNADGEMPIHCAARGGQAEIIDFFLGERRQPLDLKETVRGRTVLHLAAEYGHLDLVRKLIKLPKADIFVKSGPTDGEQLPIHLAAMNGHLPVVEAFVNSNPEIANAKNGLKHTPLQRALEDGEDAEEVISYLRGKTK